MNAKTTLFSLAAAIAIALPAAAGDGPHCPHHARHVHDREMGFSQEKTTHHFRLAADGGAIEVEANDAGDTASRDAIRSHLSELARQFTDGDLSKPHAVHERAVPGTEVMSRSKASIAYEFETTERGARVIIRSADPAALAAIHEFLRFQIEDHRTGDPPEAPTS